MIELRSVLKVRRGAYSVKIAARVPLVFDQRQKSRARVALDSGEEVMLALPRGTTLRGGDLLVASDGRVVEVVALPERLLHIEAEGAEALTRAAYHLGNRHVALQVGTGYLRIADDHVLRTMLEGLGAKVRELEAPFEPEGGAYHGEAHSNEGKPGRIHEYGEPEHVHSHDCGHDHGHDHDHDHGHHHGHSHGKHSH